MLESRLFEILLVAVIALLGFLIKRWLGGIEESIDSLCAANTKEHDAIKHENGKDHEQMWNRIHHHTHTGLPSTNGHVVIK